MLDGVDAADPPFDPRERQLLPPLSHNTSLPVRPDNSEGQVSA